MFKGIAFFIKFSWENRKLYLIFVFLRQILTGVLPIIIIAMPKYIIDELMTQQRFCNLFLSIAILVISIFFQNWLCNKLDLLTFNERCYLSAAFGEYMHKKLLNTDFFNLEDPSFYETREKANKFLYGDWHGFSYVLESALQVVGQIITALGIIAIISTMNIWLVMLFVFIVVVSAILDYTSQKKAHIFSLEAVNIERRWNYFTRILEDANYAKEIRLNQIGQWLIDAEKEHAYCAIDFYKKRNICFSRASLSNSFCDLFQNIITYAYLIYEVIKGSISIGSFSMYISAIASFSNSIKKVFTSVLDIRVYGIYYNALNEYINIKETMRDNKKLTINPTEPFTIEFRNVSFKYPGQEEYVLKNININIESGKKLSIVGENGSGKTTFIKLLCRLYDPSEGQILFNGVDIKNIDYDQYIKLFATVFQDYKLFSFSIKENIIWGKNSAESNQMIMNLINDMGLNGMIDNLPHGIDTMIHKEFDSSGVEPSGGESQRIAIARAMAKEANVIILDEPLSSLDPKAEYEIFRKFDDLTKNKTAVYISHRLSSCRFCDKIAVFHKGEICEYGTHQELIKNDGKYRELYSLQSQYYI